MNGIELDTLMTQDPHVAPYFVGVYAADTLPRRLHKAPALLICNTDPIGKPGTHWVAFHIDENREGEYWDSYGLPPYVPQHRHFLNRLCRTWTYNHMQCQALDSQVCGEYCVLYLVHRAHGHSLASFVKRLFTSDTEKNDNTVRQLFHRMFAHQRECILPANIYTQRCCSRKK